MLVTREDKCLVGRQPTFPKGMYSALAGFVEPGENLEEAGYRVITAKNGLEAVDVVARGDVQVDLALLDVVMPKLDGPKTLSRLRAQHPQLPAVFTSGYSEAPAGEHERIAVVAKPYEPDELLRAVRRALETTDEIRGAIVEDRVS